MVNHWFDDEQQSTRCGQYEGDLAEAISANGAVSCPDCWDRLGVDDLKGQWYAEDRELAEAREAAWPPEVVEMTREESAIYYTLSDAPTKSGLCDCGHDGLGMMWHMRPCLVADALHALRGVLE